MSALAKQTMQGIQAACGRLRGVAHRTRVASSRTLDAQVGCRVLAKCENEQRAGAFKFRGAYNAIATLGAEDRARGVLTFSSGNHGQALALAGALQGVAVTVVMPDNAPAVKRAATAGYGAEVITFAPAQQQREELTRALAKERGCSIIPPYDHPQIIAGQGTATVELLAQVGRLDTLLVPTGGGGLLSGAAVAVRYLQPGCRVIGIEPEMADDAVRSFRTGTLQSVDNPQTIADGARTPCLGALTFPLVTECVDDMQTVSEAAIVEAVRFAVNRMKLVLEPTGALALAALLSGVVKARGRTGVIISGGNVDGATLARILSPG